MKENSFQKKLIKEIKATFPGAVVLKNDAGYIQGFPDLTVLYEDKYVILETKRSDGAAHQPNQDYYVDKLNKMSYSRFINPDNKQEVLNDMKRIFSYERRDYGN